MKFRDLFEKESSTIHNEYKNYDDICKALKNGKKLYWANDNYTLSIDDPKTKKIGVTFQKNKSYVLLGDTKYDISRVFSK